MRSRLQLGLDVRNLSLGRRHLVNVHEVQAGIGVIASNTVWSMSKRLRGFTTRRYINPHYFTFTFPISQPQSSIDQSLIDRPSISIWLTLPMAIDCHTIWADEIDWFTDYILWKHRDALLTYNKGGIEQQRWMAMSMRTKVYRKRQRK